MKIRLTRKFALALNGVDLSRATAGEVLNLPAREAQMLVAEGWAELMDTADERPRRRRTDRGGRPEARRSGKG